MYRVIVRDRNMRPLAELHKAQDVSMAFGLSRSTSLTFRLPIWDKKTTEAFLDHTNLVSVESSNLDAWDGDITKVSFNGPYLEVTALSVEQRLSRRTMPKMKLDNVTPGEVAQTLIAQANKTQSTGIGLGVVDIGNKLVSVEYDGDRIYDRLVELAEQNKVEWRVRRGNPAQPGSWVIDFGERLGVDRTDSVVLFYGVDIEAEPQYDEDWSPDVWVNSLEGVGRDPDQGDVSQGEGGGEAVYGEGEPMGEEEQDNRPRARYIDWLAVQEDGLCEGTMDFPDVTDQDELYRRVKEEVEKRKRARRTLQFRLNERHDAWAKFSDGDIVAVHLPFYGFKGLAVPFRVKGREPSMTDGLMAVTGEILDGEQAILLNMFKFAHYTRGTGRIPVIRDDGN